MELLKMNLHLFKKNKEEKDYQPSIEDTRYQAPKSDIYGRKPVAPASMNSIDRSLEESKDSKDDTFNAAINLVKSGSAGNGQTPVATPVVPNLNFSDDNYGSISKDLINKYLNGNFSDYMNSDSYKAMQEQYSNNGQRAMQDTIGQLASRTGGMASSWAGTVGQEAYNQYMENLNSAALDAYNNEQSSILNKIQLAQNERDYQDTAKSNSQDKATQQILMAIAAGKDPSADDVENSGYSADYWKNYIQNYQVQNSTEDTYDYSEFFNNAFESDNPEEFLSKYASLYGADSSGVARQYSDWLQKRQSASIGNDSKVINGEKKYYIEGSRGDGQTQSGWFTAKEMEAMMNNGTIGMEYDPKTNTETYYVKYSKGN